MNLRWLLRMAKWARHPPSERQVVLYAIVIAVCLAIAGAEWLGLWPDWMVAPTGRRPKF